MQGKIMKGVGGFYYIHPHNTVNTIYECKAKGAFRNQKIKPAVGDDVEIEIISEQDKTGNIVEILPRENLLIRPAVGKCRSGCDRICTCRSEAKLQSVRPVFGHDGTAGR